MGDYEIIRIVGRTFLVVWINNRVLLGEGKDPTSQQRHVEGLKTMTSHHHERRRPQDHKNG